MLKIFLRMREDVLRLIKLSLKRIKSPSSLCKLGDPKIMVYQKLIQLKKAYFWFNWISKAYDLDSWDCSKNDHVDGPRPTSWLRESTSNVWGKKSIFNLPTLPREFQFIFIADNHSDAILFGVHIFVANCSMLYHLVQWWLALLPEQYHPRRDLWMDWRKRQQIFHS